ncbi:hypothetical protein [Roseivirga sp. UBA1976]|uniref:hypothetical protein n=1 Tax=Roseivirga sp. UBA1976 TaxID=1947386 RepID=UPI00257CF65F|nr:hypothetical protein [Roseivirga sp. UBA1976]MEC7754285.1 hypothetical protein [Bacteroidota bacterium]|tara:strand:+ start:5509 stop:6261 length:753 start_codon:yes stop_codon:yes gene_type:complete
MNKIKWLYLVTIILIGSNSSKIYGQANPSSSLTIFEIGSNRIEVLNLIDKEFNIHISEDTAVFENLVFDNFIGKTLVFSKGLQNVKVEVKYGFSFLQYTIDDVPAYSIPYYINYTDFYDLDVNDNHIALPDYYGNSDAMKVYELMGFESLKGIELWIQGLDFEKVRAISFKEQKSFFENLMENKTTYEECCQEYIGQAQKFLNSSIEDYKSFTDLNLELYPKQIIIVISGNTELGPPFRKTIIEKQNTYR